MNRLQFYIFLVILAFFFTSCGVNKSLRDRPNLDGYILTTDEIIKLNDSLFFKGNNSLRKNQFGQWELVAQGNPYDLGNSIGALSEFLLKKQEEIFFDKVEQLVPSKFKQYLLRKVLGIYNRKMYLHINNEYKAEILGLSKYANDKYDYIVDKYNRSLLLHGAHDIGHALQDLALVGCSSFAVWDDNTPDGDLLLARNFDFYAGDEFSKEKIIYFIQPEKGYKYVSISWAGMIGTMSGMNEKGLTITINAGKSDIPFSAKTPISLLTREILQYASTIDEAIKIAKKKEVFVSESIMVGSAIDNKAVLIETAPNNFGIYDVANTSQLICSNHFQSDAYKNDDENTTHIVESHSKYRFDRMSELLNKSKKITPEIAVSILRNKEGLQDKKIGYGNEKALNQLLAHHAVVFQPSKKMIWISANPYQLGGFVNFQLDSVFTHASKQVQSLSLNENLIKKDSFIYSSKFKDYEEYRILELKIEKAITNETSISITELDRYKSLNPYLWKVYFITGKYFYQKKQYKIALKEFEQALLHEITTVPDKLSIEKYIKKTKRKL